MGLLKLEKPLGIRTRLLGQRRRLADEVQLGQAALEEGGGVRVQQGMALGSGNP